VSSPKWRAWSAFLSRALAAVIVSTAALASTVVPAHASVTQGVDVSNNNGTVNWSQVAGAGITFGYAKVTESVNFTDSYFNANWAGMKAYGITRGAYLFWRANVDPTQEANYFLQRFESAGFTPTDLAPMIDVEVADGQSVATIAANLHTTVNVIHAALGMWPVIYTSNSFWVTSVGNDATFTADPLWITLWTANPPPPTQVPAANWGGNGFTIWQKSGTGSVPGISGSADLDQTSGAPLPLIGPGPIQAVLPALSNGAYGGYVTAATIQNIGTYTDIVHVAYYDQNGAPVGAGDANLSLIGNASWTVRQDNGNSFPSTGGDAVQAGSAVVYSFQPVATFVNEFAPGNVGDATSYSGVQVPGGVGPTLYAPTIVNNAYGGYTTGIGLLNEGSGPTDVTITYQDGAGDVIKSQTVPALAAHAYHALYSGDPLLALPAGFAGTAIITNSASQPLGAVVNETGPGGQFSSYDAVPAGSTTLNVPVALNNAFGGYYTGMGIQNTGATAGSVSVTYFDAAGTPTVKNFTIPANGSLGVYQGSATDGPAAGAYTATITSTLPLAAIVNEVAPSSTSVQQSTSYNAFASGSGTLHLPLVENAGSDPWNTGEGIMNTGSSSTVVTVTYYNSGSGATIGTSRVQTLGPHAFWGLYQPTGGLPSGTRATAVITTPSGGQVAVICNESSTTTFMSYDGQ
jgi:GH25 family lysozyme M1 (1,4-beta-N-acetylmuramidase)